MCIYRTVKEKLYHRDVGDYTSYGIEAVQGGEVIAFVSDVSVNETFVTSLSELFTKEQLSPMHLQDAIEDNLP